MTVVRPLTAFIAGALLFWVVVEHLGGFLVAIAVPASYFDWFGHERRELALALVLFVGFGLPVAALIAAGTLSIVHVLRSEAGSLLAPVFLGFVACYVFALGTAVLQVRALGGDPASVIRQVLLPHWWAAPATLGPWVGFALAAWIDNRRRARKAP